MLSVTKDRLTFGPLATAAMNLEAGGRVVFTSDGGGPLLGFITPLDVTDEGSTTKSNRSSGGAWCYRAEDLLDLEIGIYEVIVEEMYYDDGLDRYPISKVG